MTTLVCQRCNNELSDDYASVALAKLIKHLDVNHGR